MTLIIDASKDVGYAHLQRLYGCSNTVKTNKHVRFPRTTGFNSEHELVANSGLIVIAGDTFNIAPHILHIGAYAKNLGNVNIEYIMQNIHAYITLLSLLTYSGLNYSHELTLSKTLTRLISINSYNKILGVEYSLPTVLSRRFINIGMDLEQYISDKYSH